MLGDETRYFAVRIVKISKDSDLIGAGGHTGRLSTLAHHVNAEPAFRHYSFVMVDDPYLIRAGFNAVLAPHTPLAPNMDYPFGCRIDCRGGTDSLTGRVFTMIALNRDKLLVIRRVLAQIPFEYPVETLVVIEPIVILTSHLASMTPDALGGINRDSITRHGQLHEERELRGELFNKKVPPSHSSLARHSGESRNPEVCVVGSVIHWIPAFAGMTEDERLFCQPRSV
jgi:hypothetical protein